MDRMLDAAEALLAESGPDGLTVDAVIERAGTSTGSFYARFGDRSGLLVAVQERLLDRVGAELARRLPDIVASQDLETVLGALVSSFDGAFTLHRQAFNAFIVHHRTVPEMRRRGNEASTSAAEVVHTALAAHRDEITHASLRVATDLVFRTLFALCVQRVMFDEGEITGRRRSTATWRQETTRLLLAYLTT